MIVSEETIVGLRAGNKLSNLSAKWWWARGHEIKLSLPNGEPAIVRRVTAEFVRIRCTTEYGGGKGSVLGVEPETLLMQVNGRVVAAGDAKKGMMLRGSWGHFQVESVTAYKGSAIEIVGQLDEVGYLEVARDDSNGEPDLRATEGVGGQAGPSAGSSALFGDKLPTRKRASNRRAVRGDGGGGGKSYLQTDVDKRSQPSNYEYD